MYMYLYVYVYTYTYDCKVIKSLIIDLSVIYLPSSLDAHSPQVDLCCCLVCRICIKRFVASSSAT